MRAPSRQTASHHPITWAILNERCVPGDDSDDRTMAVTSTGERIGVPFDLKEPPRISFLTVYLPDRLITSPTTESILSDAVKVIAAHRDVVLLEMNPLAATLGSDDDRIDYFVFKASGCYPCITVTRDKRRDPRYIEWDGGGRGRPQASCSLCVASSGIKFVSVDTQSCSNFGVGHWKWTCTFRITTWSLLLDDDDGYTWRKDARLYAQQLWDLDPKNRFPHVTPEFPIVNMENPNAVCFMVDNDRYGSSTTSSARARACMVEIDMKNKALLAVTDYSREGSLFRLDSTKFATDLPRYLYAGEAYKKRRQE
ncbi:hypothetical protein PR202_ga25172 [Eleusine coracana subsp. coracana]|uniref:DUF1618 domain-containing protein n=1 Tax=Eleusine coracana subsp. coracana TaxID=191504 RepID=A0AAV5D8T5_ELECO|nr:hypothetical protein PR202_ga25172 [Eleusine coracana subsp. coracana]